ncbi:helix-turn-helix domain-containing protein [Streptomyces phytophilus]|uniref:helix-turn-helix domain-containing protein n=1 Tax=Streptomyces phytophilus TaxID=722715 RepID=UPI0015F0BF46|nr:helix-turn-helix domain-containing protein [Streptomyces phytophilus]
MNTTDAAAQAGVTTPTIRLWCRIGALAAVKHAGRWIINTASLAARIAIGHIKGKAMTTTGTLVEIPGQYYGVRGDTDTLAAAYQNGAAVTVDSGPYAGDRVYLGLTRWTLGGYGRTQEILGLAYTKDDGQAVYYLDTNRLAEAPAIAAAFQRFDDEVAAADAKTRAQDDAYLNDPYE